MNASILVLLPYALGTTPSQRFRWEQWAPHLETQGCSIHLASYLDGNGTAVLQQPGRTLTKTRAVLAGFRRRLADLRRLHRYACVVIHRAAFFAGPARLDLAFCRGGVPAVFDFDDAIYLQNSSGANPLLDWLKFPPKTARLCSRSRLVTAGSHYLAAWAARHSTNVRVVPTSIDIHRYRRTRPRATTGPVVVGWSGSSTSQQHLEQFAPVLRQLVASRLVELRVVSNRPPQLQGLAVSWRPWSPDTEISEIEQFDIGIKPLPDDGWARGKCPMKELQYMALEIPAICSAVGATTEAVEHGNSGFLASNEQEWLTYLYDMADSPDLRWRMGRAGRTIVEQRYATTVAVRTVMDSIGELTSHGSTATKGLG